MAGCPSWEEGSRRCLRHLRNVVVAGSFGLYGALKARASHA
jgi:hypothetical protein